VILVGSQRMDGFSADKLDAMLAAAGWGVIGPFGNPATGGSQCSKRYA